MNAPTLRIASFCGLAAALLPAAACSRAHRASAPERAAASGHRAWTPPDPSHIPGGPLGESIRLGKRIFDDTPTYAAAFVGDRLSCNDCHIQSGTAAYAVPMAGLPGIFPIYNQRDGRVISLEDRIENCFLRSENGRRLPPEGPEMIGLLAYIQWLSQGVPAGQTPPGRGLSKLPDLDGDTARGAKLYLNQCASCHGVDGAGQPPVLPAIWGPDAYNTGAGMNQIPKMAAFLAHNMPQNHPDTLSSQEAYDVAAYVASKPHTPFRASSESVQPY